MQCCVLCSGSMSHREKVGELQLSTMLLRKATPGVVLIVCCVYCRRLGACCPLCRLPLVAEAMPLPADGGDEASDATCATSSRTAAQRPVSADAVAAVGQPAVDHSCNWRPSSAGSAGVGDDAMKRSQCGDVIVIVKLPRAAAEGANVSRAAQNADDAV